jgi:hypothetical protein
LQACAELQSDDKALLCVAPDLDRAFGGPSASRFGPAVDSARATRSLLPFFWSAGSPRLTSSVPLSAAAPRAELPPEERKGSPGRGADTSARPPLPTAKVGLAQDDGDVSGTPANSSCRCARDRRCREGRACAGQGTNLCLERCFVRSFAEDDDEEPRWTDGRPATPSMLPSVLGPSRAGQPPGPIASF